MATQARPDDTPTLLRRALMAGSEQAHAHRHGWESAEERRRWYYVLRARAALIYGNRLHLGDPVQDADELHAALWDHLNARVIRVPEADAIDCAGLVRQAANEGWRVAQRGARLNEDVVPVAVEPFEGHPLDVPEMAVIVDGDTDDPDGADAAFDDLMHGVGERMRQDEAAA